MHVKDPVYCGASALCVAGFSAELAHMTETSCVWANAAQSRCRRFRHDGRGHGA